jgi:hypothetical protein
MIVIEDAPALLGASKRSMEEPPLGHLVGLEAQIHPDCDCPTWSILQELTESLLSLQ